MNQKRILVVIIEITFRSFFKYCLGEEGVSGFTSKNIIDYFRSNREMPLVSGNILLSSSKNLGESTKGFEKKQLNEAPFEKGTFTRSTGPNISFWHPALPKVFLVRCLVQALVQTSGSIIIQLKGHTRASSGHTIIGLCLKTRGNNGRKRRVHCTNL
ncbi:hypothetical protein PVK06_000964 [Gossypium arboreum]|uniref:Uncharacterized protein n=1 Tax=Gossypium arboreum TaxID=29729 RepID=A0ABR0R144_GOSAR|nr:hypothetical protein PVK06_000964 [Gossypium arboreum]